jgi:hypothetical protein
MAEIELPFGWSNFVSGCGECIPVAPDGISEEYILFSSGVGGTRFSWSFIEDNPGGEIVYEAGTNYPFAPLEQMFKSTNDVITADIFPDGVNSPSNLSPGISDRVMFGMASGGTFYLFTLDADSQLEFTLGGHGFSGTSVRNWSVEGDTLFIGGDDLTDGIGGIIIAKYTISTQAFVSFIVLEAGLLNVQTIHYTGDFVYVLAKRTANDFVVFKYSSDLVLLDTFELNPVGTNDPYIAIYAESDETIYWIQKTVSGGGNVAIGYINDMSSQVTLDDDVTGTGFANDAAPWVMIVHTDETTQETFLYLGRGTGSVIYKYGPIECAA